jgi:hypothetical protein
MGFGLIVEAKAIVFLYLSINKFSSIYLFSINSVRQGLFLGLKELLARLRPNTPLLLKR